MKELSKLQQKLVNNILKEKKITQGKIDTINKKYQEVITKYQNLLNPLEEEITSLNTAIGNFTGESWETFENNGKVEETDTTTLVADETATVDLVEIDKEDPKVDIFQTV